MMDKKTYFAELENELKGLGDEDRQNIIAYYYEYMIDAEAEQQAGAEAAKPTKVEDVLGSPHTLAAQIKADIAMAPLSGNPKSAEAPTGQSAHDHAPMESVYSDSSKDSAKQQGAQYSSSPYNASSSPYATAAPSSMPMPAPANPGNKQKSGMGVVWAVILAILAIPVGIPLAITLFALIFSVLLTVFLILLALGITLLALFVLGIVAIVFGFILLFSSPPVGVFYIGSGLAVLGLSLLLAVGLWKLTQLTFKGVAKLFNAIRKKIVNRKQVAQ